MNARKAGLWREEKAMYWVVKVKLRKIAKLLKYILPYVSVAYEIISGPFTTEKEAEAEAERMNKERVGRDIEEEGRGSSGGNSGRRSRIGSFQSLLQRSSQSSSTTLWPWEPSFGQDL